MGGTRAGANAQSFFHADRPFAGDCRGSWKKSVSRAEVLLHGTTVGTNTLLQRKGARVALVTTAGFEDAIEFGPQARPKLYDFF